MKDERGEPADLRERTKAYALRIIRLYASLPKGDVAATLGRQVLKSGTSVGANFREAHRARSNAEFISKIGDCLKELEESSYWMELLVDSKTVPVEKLTPLLNETSELTAVLTTISKKVRSRA